MIGLDGYLEAQYEDRNGDPEGLTGGVPDWECPNEDCAGWHWCGDEECPIDCGEFDCAHCENAPG